MTAEEGELARAELKSRAARAQLTATLVDLQARINPRTLAREAIDELRTAGHEVARAGLEAAKRNPGPLLAVGATIIALFARGRIADALQGKPTTSEDATEMLQPSLPATGPAPTEGFDHD